MALPLIGRWLVTTGAGAQESSSDTERTYTLEYVAPEGCPDREAFVAAVQARTPSATYVPDGEGTLNLRVRLLEGGSSTLWVDLPDGSSRRQFDEPACADAVDSIAVIASMVLEAVPARRLLATEQPPEPGPLERPTLVAPAPSAPLSPAKPPGTMRDAAPPRRSASDWGVALAAGPAIESAVAPSPPLALTVGLEGSLRRKGPWVPRLRAEALLSLEATERRALGEGQFQLMAGRLSACPLQLELDARVRVLPCISAPCVCTETIGIRCARCWRRRLRPTRATTCGSTLRSTTTLTCRSIARSG